MTARVLVFGYGNPGRGDDALGPMLLERLEAGLGAADRQAAGGIEFLTDFQLQIEHALDLTGRDLVLFIDAHASCPPPCTLERLYPATDRSYTTHALHPAAVLRVFREIRNAEPPPAFLLSVRGAGFELGMPLTPEAERGLAAALELALGLCRRAELAGWLEQCHAPMELRM